MVVPCYNLWWYLAILRVYCDLPHYYAVFNFLFKSLVRIRGLVPSVSSFFSFPCSVRSYLCSRLLAMSSSRKICSTCCENVELKYYSHHVNTHNAKFQCSLCPSLSFNRRDSRIRHMKCHRPQISNDEPSSTPQEHIPAGEA